VLSHSEIKSILPHRYPMLLVDRVVSLEPGNRITAVKNVTGNEPCFAGLVDGLEPSAYAYPNSLVIESFCQAAGILYAAEQSEVRATGKVMLFGSIARFRFHADIFPGQTMEHHVRLEKALTDSAVFSGEVRVDGKAVADVERVVVAIRPASVLAAAASGR
jgi:3-hydroxyacyl-[acyl-carrier-protein] dehydratase